MSFRAAFVTFGLVVLTTACGNHSPASPTSPSTSAAAAAPSPSAPLGSGAIVSGTVVSVTAASRLHTLATPITVAVTGTSISSAVDSTGRFTLQNVPAGHVELHFTGTGIDARLGLDDVAEHQTITIVVRVSGTTAQLDNNEREDPNHNAEVEGLVTSTSPLTVAGKTITVSAATTIVHGDTAMALSSIHVNDRIHVHGTATSATEIAATKIEVQNGVETPGNGAEQESEFEGTVSTLLANGFTMNSGAQTVTVTAKTVIRQDSHTLTLANIHVGDRVEVKGTASGSTIAADTIEVKGPSTDDGGDDHGGNPGNNNGGQVELSGTVANRSSSCPVNFFVGTTHVFTDVNGAKTEFKDTTCTALKNTDRVEVKGTKQADGSVAATRVEKK